jgi:hypothetical protein
MKYSCGQAIVFCNTIARIEIVYEQFNTILLCFIVKTEQKSGMKWLKKPIS